MRPRYRTACRDPSARLEQGWSRAGAGLEQGEGPGGATPATPVEAADAVAQEKGTPPTVDGP